MTKEAMKLALEALESCTPEDTSTSHVIYAWHDEELVNKAIKALEEALAKQEQSVSVGEPVAKYIGEDWAGSLVSLYEEIPLGTLLYTTPQQRKPLTDEQIDKAWRSVDYTVPWEQHRIDIARAIEAAHGIKENT